MDVEYLWILQQEKKCRQFRLLFPLALIGRAFYPVGGEGIDPYFSPLESSLYHRT